MFSNIDGKLKGLAIALCTLGIVVSIAYGYFVGQLDVGLEIIYAAVGSFITWVISALVYGLGELIAKTGTTNRQLDEIKNLLTPPPTADPNRNWQPNTDDFLVPTKYDKNDPFFRN